MNIDENAEAVMPFEEVVKRINRTRKKRLFVHVGTWAQFTVQNPAKDYEQGVTRAAVVPMTRKQLVKYLHDCFPEHWRPKLSLTVAEYSRTMFIGTAPGVRS